MGSGGRSAELPSDTGEVARSSKRHYIEFAIDDATPVGERSHRNGFAKLMAFCSSAGSRESPPLRQRAKEVFRTLAADHTIDLHQLPIYIFEVHSIEVTVEYILTVCELPNEEDCPPSPRVPTRHGTESNFVSAPGIFDESDAYWCASKIADVAKGPKSARISTMEFLCCTNLVGSQKQWDTQPTRYS